MHVVIGGVSCTVWTNIWVCEAHFKQPFLCVVYPVNNLILYELDVGVGRYREDIFADLGPEVGTGRELYVMLPLSEGMDMSL